MIQSIICEAIFFKFADKGRQMEDKGMIKGREREAKMAEENGMEIGD